MCNWFCGGKNQLLSALDDDYNNNDHDDYYNDDNYESIYKNNLC